MSNWKNVKELYNLPFDVKFCTRCVISNQRPRITFNKDGVCSACQYAERKKYYLDWNKREEELIRLLDRYRSKDGSFDVVVPCSGGKDSAYVAHQLKYTYGMHPLTVTWSPHLYTPVGWKNLENFIASGFDNILGTPNGKTHRRLTRLAFEILGDPFQPFIYGQKAFPMQIATKYKIPLVMYGENGEVEYGGDAKNEDSPEHDLQNDMIKHYFSGIGPMEWTKYCIPKEDLLFYMPPPLEEMNRVGVKCYFFGYFKKWIPKYNYEYAVENTGFSANHGERSEGTYTNYASLDDKIDGFHYYMAYIKFGLGRATSDAAHEIRDGHLTREEAVDLVKQFDGEFPNKNFQSFLEYTGMTDLEFWENVENWRSPHLWQQVDGHWELRNQIS
ncbi:MAG: N-acetyl sugar amidotransferase [Anaerolineaceae bacterium]